jgi:NADH-quinone oxidoreductase subunit J
MGITVLVPLCFYLLATCALLSAASILIFRKTLYSVFALILTVLSTAGLFLLAGAEFLSLTLIIVHVGAVAVLFLFVVALVGEEEIPAPPTKRLSVLGCWMTGLLFGGTLGGLLLQGPKQGGSLDFWEIYSEPLENTQALGEFLYTLYFLPFQVTGLILLAVTIGVVTLVLQKNGKTSLKHTTRDPLNNTPGETVRLVSSPLREGLK